MYRSEILWNVRLINAQKGAGGEEAVEGGLGIINYIINNVTITYIIKRINVEKKKKPKNRENFEKSNY